jgi:hypothetical protein
VRQTGSVRVEEVRLLARVIADAEADLTSAVIRSRQVGAAWSEIASALGVAKQSAWQRYHAGMLKVPTSPSSVTGDSQAAEETARYPLCARRGGGGLPEPSLRVEAPPPDHGHGKKGLPRRVAGEHPDTCAWLPTYTPRLVSQTEWTEIGPFVTSAVIDSEPASMTIARTTCWAVIRHVIWCRGQGIELDRERVFDPDTVERFTATLPTNASQNTSRSCLRRVGRRVTRQAPWEPSTRRPSHGAHLDPYPDEEIELYRRVARAQSSPARARFANALISLGAGAGLDGRWAWQVRGDDIVRLTGGLGVRVGPPCARVVPVLLAF